MDTKQLTDEINLKAMTALGTIISDEERGLITKAQAMTGVRAIFDTVGGLIPSESFDLISAAADQYKGAVAYDVGLVKVGDHIEGVIRVVHTSAILRINRAAPHKLPANNDDVDIASTRRYEASQLLHNIRTQGAW